MLIPAYKPEPILESLCRRLSERQLDILVVDDGSGAAFAPLFESCKPFASVIGYEANGGKGHAIKHGLAYIRDHSIDWKYIVTADADGQHAVEDIVRCAARVRETDSIVIGARTLTGGIPTKSRIGNFLTRFDYAVSCALYLEDNQTGLRAFGRDDIDWLLQVDGERYEYELNVLLYAGKRNMRIEEVPIETIYVDNNRGSHFDPIRDTLRLHGKVLVASAPSLLAIVEGYLFALLLYYERPLPVDTDAWWYPYLCLILMGLLTAAMSFLMNTFLYFISRGRGKRITGSRVLTGAMRIVFDLISMAVLYRWMRVPFWGASLAAIVLSSIPLYWTHKSIRKAGRHA